MTVKQIVEKYLKDNGYDGLQCYAECGCTLNDLMPCEENFSECTPGYIKDCKKCEYFKNNECDFGFSFCITSEKNDN